MPVTYEPIATTTLGGAAADITFSSIPSTYTDLRAVLSFIPSASMYLNGRFNNFSSLSYSETYIYGNGASATSSRHGQYTFWQVEPIIFSVGKPYLLTMDIFGYANTSIRKTFMQSVSSDENGAGFSYQSVGNWSQTSAINQISFYYNGSNCFAAGTRATIYGIKAA